MGNPVKKIASTLKTAISGGGSGDVATDVPAVKSAVANPAAEGDEAVRAARRRPLAKLSAKSGRLANVLGTANTLG